MDTAVGTELLALWKSAALDVVKNLLPVTLVISKEFMQFRRKLKHVAKYAFLSYFWG